MTIEPKKGRLMPLNKPQDEVRLKAQQMREAQAKADRRTRMIIISIVLIVVLAVIATVAIVISNQVNKKNAAIDADPATTLGEYANGEPIIYSHLGVGKKDEALPTLTEYFDYSCHACADIDVALGHDLVEGAERGEYNLEIQPVTTVGMAYELPATSASLIVAREDPEHWISFHHALLSYFASQFNSGKGTVIQDLDKSWEQVKVIAKEQGVSDEVVAKLPPNVVEKYLEASTQAWRDAPIQGRGNLGTPEFVKDHSTEIPLSGSNAAEFLSVVRAAMGLKTE